MVYIVLKSHTFNNRVKNIVFRIVSVTLIVCLCNGLFPIQALPLPIYKMCGRTADVTPFEALSLPALAMPAKVRGFVRGVSDRTTWSRLLTANRKGASIQQFLFLTYVFELGISLIFKGHDVLGSILVGVILGLMVVHHRIQRRSGGQAFSEFKQNFQDLGRVFAFRIPINVVYLFLRFFIRKNAFEATLDTGRWWLSDVIVLNVLVYASTMISPYWGPIGLWAFYCAWIFSVKKINTPRWKQFLAREYIVMAYVIGSYAFVYDTHALLRLYNAMRSSADLIKQAPLLFSILAGLNLNVIIAKFGIRHGLAHDATTRLAILRFLSDQPDKKPYEDVAYAGYILRAYTSASDLVPLSFEEQLILFDILCNTPLHLEYIRTVSDTLALSMQQNPASLPAILTMIQKDPKKDSKKIRRYIDSLGTYIHLKGATVEEGILLDLLGMAEFVRHRAFLGFFLNPLSMKQPGLFNPVVKKTLYLANVNAIPAHIKNLRSRLALELNKLKKEVLIIHNIEDGWGDEIIRNAALIEGLLMSYPNLRVTLYTGRAGRYHHPRVQAFDIKTVPFNHQKDFALIVDHYEPARAYNRKIERDLRTYLRSGSRSIRASRVFVKYNMGFVLKFIGMNRPSRQKPQSFSKAVSPYDSIYTLCKWLGIAFPYGEQPRPESILGGRMASEKEENFYKANVEPANVERRPLLIFNGFGGTFASKGIVSAYLFANSMEQAILKGYFVLLTPNHQPWGSVDKAQRILELVKPKLRPYVLIAPYTPGNDLFYARLIKRAAFVLTVEGGLVHLAYALGKQMGVMFVTHSGDLLDWFPQGAGPNQFAIHVAWGALLSTHLPEASSNSELKQAA